MSDSYEPYLRQGNPVVFMDELSFELSKYTTISLLANRISLINEIAQLCERFVND